MMQIAERLITFEDFAIWSPLYGVREQKPWTFTWFSFRMMPRTHHLRCSFVPVMH